MKTLSYMFLSVVMLGVLFLLCSCTTVVRPARAPYAPRPRVRIVVPAHRTVCGVWIPAARW